MTQEYESKRQAVDFAKRIFGVGAVERGHYSVLRVASARYLLSHLNRYTDEEWQEICEKAMQASDNSGVVQIDGDFSHISANTLETAASGDMMLPTPARMIGRYILPEESSMSKKSDSTKKAPAAKPPAGKFTPGDKKGPPKKKDAEQLEQEAQEKAAAGGEGAPDFAKEPADPKAGKPAKAPKAEKAPKEPKPPKEPAPPRGLSPKMDQMLKLALSDAGLTHKDICAITGSTNPPQTQLVERLRKHVDGTLEKVRPEGARGFVYKIKAGDPSKVPAPTTDAAPAAPAEGVDEAEGGEPGDENGDGDSPDAGEIADTLAGAEAATA